MRHPLLRWARRLALVALGALAAVLAVRAWEAWHGPPLEPWHTFVPDELDADAIAGLDWTGYLAAEAAILAEVEAEVTAKLEPAARVATNRYYAGSPLYPGRRAENWNRSQVLEPDGTPRGAMVFLHGLTDAPFSGRHLGRAYRDAGFVVVVPRLPGHGTVPAGLTGVAWPDWAAATRLAVEEARRRAGPGPPLHLIGYSNGGALAVAYALDALDDATLARPDRLVLLSPMIGITAFARFAGIAGWPAVFPAFARAAWLSVEPEFNPMKYNSFPVNGARQSFQLTRALQARLERAARSGRLAELPPILTFQSLVDFTVSPRSVITTLYDRLPANGSELVLVDLNRSAKLGPLLVDDAETILERVVPPPPRPYRLIVVANAAPGRAAMQARITEPGSTEETVRPLGLAYPPEVYSLSHVALPFPVSDGLYGLEPDPADDLGVNLGAMALRGERGALAVSLDGLMRMSSNPFFPYLLERVAAGMAR